jgi:hypothetical protein
MVLKATTGNVGIGTTSPAERLHVEYGEVRVRASHNNTTSDIGAFYAKNLTEGIGIGYNRIQAIGSNDNQDILLLPKGTGNVGIGTTTPHSLLDLGTSLGRKLAVWQDNEEFYGFGISGGTLEVYTAGTTEPSMVLKATTGNVGIGTSSPQAKLDVNGHIRLSNVPVWNGTDDNDLTWNWHMITREGSSRRFKRNITSLTDDFHKILELDSKRFQMKEGYGPPDRWNFGYIAEELDEIGLTNLVTYDEQGLADGIKYKKMCIYLNEVVKSQQKSIQELEQDLNNLTEQVHDISKVSQ